MICQKYCTYLAIVLVSIIYGFKCWGSAAISESQFNSISELNLLEIQSVEPNWTKYDSSFALNWRKNQLDRTCNDFYDSIVPGKGNCVPY